MAGLDNNTDNFRFFKDLNKENSNPNTNNKKKTNIFDSSDIVSPFPKLRPLIAHNQKNKKPHQIYILISYTFSRFLNNQSSPKESKNNQIDHIANKITTT